MEQAASHRDSRFSLTDGWAIPPGNNQETWETLGVPSNTISEWEPTASNGGNRTPWRSKQRMAGMAALTCQLAGLLHSTTARKRRRCQRSSPMPSVSGSPQLAIAVGGPLGRVNGEPQGWLLRPNAWLGLPARRQPGNVGDTRRPV